MTLSSLLFSNGIVRFKKTSIFWPIFMFLKAATQVVVLNDFRNEICIRI